MSSDSAVVAGRRATDLPQRLLRGALAGLAGGVVFGAMMGVMGMLPMIAGLVGSSSAIVGLILHFIFSAIIGAGYGLVFGRVPASAEGGSGWGETYLGGLWSGAVYGFVWWILGPMVIMPVWMGMGPQFGMAGDPMMLMSLVGHLVYGVVTGLAYAFLTTRAR